MARRLIKKSERLEKERLELEKKNHSSSSSGYMDIANCIPIHSLFGSGIAPRLSNQAAWGWYGKIQPLRHAVDGLISTSFASIQPEFYDTFNDVFVSNDENKELLALSKLIKKPNFDVTGNEIKKQGSSSYTVTGDLYWMVTAMSEESEPLEWYYIDPQTVNPVNGSDGFVLNYTVSGTKWNETFKRKVLSDGKVIFVTNDGTKELWHVRHFNPNENDPSGLSPISSELQELEQYFGANASNNSTLKNGARPSGVVMMPADVDISEDQEEYLRNKFSSQYASAQNAGEIILIQGGTKFEQLSTNNKDMDFVNMMDRITKRLYLTNNIPLPLIESGTMTMNNYAESKEMLFDLNIIPFSNMYYQDELTRFLMRRVDDSGRYEIRVNEESIPALRGRFIRQAKELIDTKKLTDNESRELLNRDGIGPNGDVIYHATSDIPVGQTDETLNKKNFIESLKKNGKYSDTEIKKQADILYGRNP